MIYRIMLHVLIFNEEIDKKLNNILWVAMKSGIQTMDLDLHHSTVIFKDGTRFYYWNCNKYYAWLTQGVVDTPKQTYRWHNGRPHAKTMYYFKMMIDYYEKTK